MFSAELLVFLAQQSSGNENELIASFTFCLLIDLCFLGWIWLATLLEKGGDLNSKLPTGIKTVIYIGCLRACGRKKNDQVGCH